MLSGRSGAMTSLRRECYLWLLPVLTRDSNCLRPPPARRDKAIAHAADASLDAFWHHVIPPRAPRSPLSIVLLSERLATRRIEVTWEEFSIDWSRIRRIVTNTCMIYMNLSFGNHLSELFDGEMSEVANTSMIGQFSGYVINTTLTFR
jgi:hypothetical protein